jgi:antirestriction protein ArdC
MRADHDDRLTEAHEKLTTAVEQLASGEDWAAMLDVAARFHRYSLNNVLLIHCQMPEATRVAGYRAWQALGHQVRRGEHGLSILAPVVRRVALGEGDEPRRTDQTDGEHGAINSRDGKAKRKVLAGFKVAKVFDVSQTDGPPLPDVVPIELTGEAPDALYDGLAGEVAAAGFTLHRADCSPANGRTDFPARTVTVRPDCSTAQAAKTLAHELGHVRLHDDPKFFLGGFACRGLAEIEAESVAYLVCSAAGLSTDAYSFPYVARWANGDVALVRSAAERSLTAAREVTTSLGLSPAPSDPVSETVVARAAAAAPTRTATPTPAPAAAPQRSVAR